MRPDVFLLRAGVALEGLPRTVPRSSRALVTGALALALLLTAGCGGEEGPRPLGVEGAHEHGVARVNLAVDGASATVEFTAPAAEIYGFERAPRTEEEEARRRAGIEAVRTRMGEALQFEPELGCALVAREVADNGGHGEEHDHGHDADHDHGHSHDPDPAHDTAHAHDHGQSGDHDHDHDQDHDHDHDHDHDQDPEHDHDHGHLDVRATFDVQCQAPISGSRLRLTFDQVFSGIVDVDLQVVGDRTFGGRYRASGTRVEL
jgi:hypothetical protein